MQLPIHSAKHRGREGFETEFDCLIGGTKRGREGGASKACRLVHPGSTRLFVLVEAGLKATAGRGVAVQCLSCSLCGVRASFVGAECLCPCPQFRTATCCPCGMRTPATALMDFTFSHSQTAQSGGRCPPLAWEILNAGKRVAAQPQAGGGGPPRKTGPADGDGGGSTAESGATR